MQHIKHLYMQISIYVYIRIIHFKFTGKHTAHKLLTYAHNMHEETTTATTKIFTPTEF